MWGSGGSSVGFGVARVGSSVERGGSGCFIWDSRCSIWGAGCYMGFSELDMGHWALYGALRAGCGALGVTSGVGVPYMEFLGRCLWGSGRCMWGAWGCVGFRVLYGVLGGSVGLWVLLCGVLGAGCGLAVLCVGLWELCMGFSVWGLGCWMWVPGFMGAGCGFWVFYGGSWCSFVGLLCGAPLWGAPPEFSVLLWGSGRCLGLGAAWGVWALLCGVSPHPPFSLWPPHPHCPHCHPTMSPHPP